MKKSSTGRRVPRKIGEDDEDDLPPPPSAATASSSDTSVRRPAAKPRKSSGLRSTFTASAGDDDDDDSEPTLVTPKRSALSRVAIQRNASKRSSLNPAALPIRPSDDEDDRPSYSAASLRELKESTPTTPQEFSSAGNTDTDEFKGDTLPLDISSKFGSTLTRYQDASPSSAIPSATEIAEKKARRARLAKEQEADEYISLDPDDPELDDDDSVMRDDRGRLVLKPKDKYGLTESRLVRDDEDIMENFDDFTEDGKVSLGRKAEAEAARKRKQEMAAQIAEAEGVSDSDSDDGERERNAVFEAAQTKHGTYGQTAADSDPADARPRTPPIITPIPTLDSVIGRLRKQVIEMQSSRMQKLQGLEHLQREKIRLAEEEVRIQRALKETAEKFEQLRREKGIGAAHRDSTPAIAAKSPLNGMNTNDEIATPPGVEDVDDGNGDVDEEVDEEDELERPSFGGLGFRGARQGFGVGLGFSEANDAERSDNAMIS